MAGPTSPRSVPHTGFPSSLGRGSSRLTEREAETSQAGWSWSCTDPHHLPGLHQPPHPSIPDPDSIPWGAGCGRPELQVAKALLCPGFPHLSIYHRHGTRSTGDVWVTTWEQTPPCPLGDCSPASTCRSGSVTSASWCLLLPGQEPWFSETQLCSLLSSLSTRPSAVGTGLKNTLRGCLGLRAGGSVVWHQDRSTQVYPWSGRRPVKGEGR